MRRSLRLKRRDSETCCTRLGGLFHFSLTWDSRLEPPTLYCFCVHMRQCVFVLVRATLSLVYVRLCAVTVYLLPLVPCSLLRHQLWWDLSLFPSVLEVMWLALQGRHHHYTHISAEILPEPAALHRNPREMIIMTSTHSRGKR